MKIQMVRTTVFEVDVDKDRNRINRLFKGDQKKRLLKLCDLFEDGKLSECAEFIETWGRCPELECPEIEFIDMVMYDIIVTATYGEGVRVNILDNKPPVKPESKMEREPEVGDYVLFWDTAYPKAVKGWLETAKPDNDFYQIQCDDGFEGARSQTCKREDFIEILPFEMNIYNVVGNGEEEASREYDEHLLEESSRYDDDL